VAARVAPWRKSIISLPHQRCRRRVRRPARVGAARAPHPETSRARARIRNTRVSSTAWRGNAPERLRPSP
jgi:hypothetical protein